MDLKTLLSHGLNKMALTLSEETQEKLISYVELLEKWNRRHNLTAVRDPQEMVIRHLLDSLTVISFLSKGKTVCDVGTGAGLPGIILALCKGDMDFILLDSNQKKIHFVQQALLSLEIQNAKAVCSRVEQYHPSVPLDWIMSRAFASLSDFIQQTRHLSHENTRWLAMKGKLLPEELAALPTGYTMEQVQAVIVPNLDAERHIVLVKKIGSD